MMEQTHIGLVIYPGAQLSAVYGLLDLFSTANRLAIEKTERVFEPLCLSRWHLISDIGHEERVELSDHDALQRPPQLAIIIIPPNLDYQGSVPSPVLLEWLKCQHGRGAILCSVCTAAFFLGHAGLLNGRPATTHWGLKNIFLDQFPEVFIQTDQTVVDDGDIVTAGGVMAWIDLGLFLIGRCLGPSIMLEVAQFFGVDPNGREQRFYSKFSPRLHHGDKDILRVQHWLQRHYPEPVFVTDMASVAALGERTFLRRFKVATRMKPLEYLQALRIGKAQEMLEFSRAPFNEIAWKVGYEDLGAFRKIFQRLIGLQPREYRRRFMVRHRE